MHPALVSFLALLALPGCAGGPRPHVPILVQPPTDAAAYEQVYQACRTEVSEGKDERLLATAATATGAGLLTSYGSGAAALMVAGSVSTSASTIFSAAAAGMLIGAPVGVYLVTKGNRDRIERDVQTRMQLCLGKEGYSVAAWQQVKAAS
jgi:hypothetical protein